jgi:hypothetical protein
MGFFYLVNAGEKKAFCVNSRFLTVKLFKINILQTIKVLFSKKHATVVSCDSLCLQNMNSATLQNGLKRGA